MHRCGCRGRVSPSIPPESSSAKMPNHYLTFLSLITAGLLPHRPSGLVILVMGTFGTWCRMPWREKGLVPCRAMRACVHVCKHLPFRERILEIMVVPFKKKPTCRQRTRAEGCHSHVHTSHMHVCARVRGTRTALYFVVKKSWAQRSDHRSGRIGYA